MCVSNMNHYPEFYTHLSSYWYKFLLGYKIVHSNLTLTKSLILHPLTRTSIAFPTSNHLPLSFYFFGMNPQDYNCQVTWLDG